MRTALHHSVEQELQELKNQNLHRQLLTISSGQSKLVDCNGQQLLNFSANDYLGLAASHYLKQALIRGAELWGCGAGASRLVCGNLQVHRDLELRLAQFKGYQDAIVFPSGYMANLGMLGAFAGPKDLIIADKLAHASLIDGARLSGAKLRVFPHLNYQYLSNILAKKRHLYAKIFVVTDSIFSMDGDCANLVELAKICQKYEALLLTDEAHAVGVWGAGGRGLAESQNVSLPVSMGTLSKSLGCQGGYICGSNAYIDLLRNRARSFIYTTGVAPVMAYAAIAAVDYVEQNQAARVRLLALAAKLRLALASAGYDTLGSSTQVIPIFVGRNEATLKVAAMLRELGVLVVGIRYPTVPHKLGRLRISLTAGHTWADCQTLLKALATVKARGAWAT